MKTFALITSIAIAAFAAASDAAIIKQAETVQQATGTGNSVSLSVVDETGGNANSLLVFAISAVNDSGALPTLDWDGDTDIAPVLSIEEDTSGLFTGIYVFDIGNVTTPGTATVNHDGGLARERATLIQLSGATVTGAILNNGGGSGTSNATSVSTTLDGVAPGSFVLTVGAVQNNARSLTSVTGENDFNDYIVGNNRGHFIAWDEDSAGGDLTTGFTVSGDSDGMSIAAISLAEVPEPASMALLGLGGLMMLRRRARLRPDAV